MILFAGIIVQHWDCGLNNCIYHFISWTHLNPLTETSIYCFTLHSLIQATLGCLPVQEFGLNQDIQVCKNIYM